MKKIIKISGTIGITIVGIIIIFATINIICIQQFRTEYNNPKSAINVMLEELQQKKIIGIGEDHDRVNEKLFVAGNIQALYNAGVRYIFLESGVTPEQSLPGSETYVFPMFYPWMNTGWRYESLALYQAVIDFNNNLQTDDIIKIVYPQKVPDEISDVEQYWNKRDSSAAETIIERMDASPDGAKAIIVYGAAHMVAYPYEQYFLPYAHDEKFKWYPLGYLLKNHYENNFTSYYFITEHKDDLLINQKYLLDESKLVLFKNIPVAKLPIAYKPYFFDVRAIFPLWTHYNGWHDWIIVEPETIYGTFYQYNPTDENLSFILKFVEDYAMEYNPDIDYIPYEAKNNIPNGINFLKKSVFNGFDYTSPSMTYAVDSPQWYFMLGLYYLKMYFGDQFDYTFLKIESSKNLLNALTELREYAFYNNAPSENIKTNYCRNIMNLFHNYMFLSRIVDFNEQEISGKEIKTNYLLLAHEIFPDDLWPLYWLGFVETERENWDKGLEYFQELFSYDLAFSMESLPLAFKKAALCAVNLGKQQLAEEYQSTAEALYNDFNIIVDQNRTSFVGYSYDQWTYERFIKQE